ncbi:MAG: hypothetical protein JNK24_00215 [Alphaproteobacteria bacterium]|nr:hypothetical protein [Alphaproteobacteria bacterium]
MKRFYKKVSIIPSAEPLFAVAEPVQTWQILLDGREIKTPSHYPLIAPNKALAELIRDEWMAQGNKIIPADMPITQTLTTIIDYLVTDYATHRADILSYLDTDLLCYYDSRQESAHAKLRAPILTQLSRSLGCEFLTTDQLQPIIQSPDTADKVTQAVPLDPTAQGVALVLLTKESGSLLLALAFVKGLIDKDIFMRAVFVEEDLKDEIYNAPFYGRAPDHDRARESLTHSLRFFELLRD